MPPVLADFVEVVWWHRWFGGCGVDCILRRKPPRTRPWWCRTARACWRKRWSFWRQFGEAATPGRARDQGVAIGLARRVQKLMALKDGEWRGLSFRNRWLLKVCGPLPSPPGAIACFAWTGSSRGTPQDEWRHSLAGRTIMHSAPQAENVDAERIPGLLGDARYFLTPENSTAEGLCEKS